MAGFKTSNHPTNAEDLQHGPRALQGDPPVQQVADEGQRVGRGEPAEERGPPGRGARRRGEGELRGGGLLRAAFIVGGPVSRVQLPGARGGAHGAPRAPQRGRAGQAPAHTPVGCQDGTGVVSSRTAEGGPSWHQGRARAGRAHPRVTAMHAPCPMAGRGPARPCPGRVAGESAMVGLLVTSPQTRFHSPGQSTTPQAGRADSVPHLVHCELGWV